MEKDVDSEAQLLWPSEAAGLSGSCTVAELKHWFINRHAFSEPGAPCLAECPVDTEDPTNLC